MNPGRPTVMGEKTLAKLEASFLDGYSDDEACLIAEINPSTLYRYCDDNPDFATKKELLKKHPNISARRNILKAIESGDLEMSKWYLERKTGSEFNLRLMKVDDANEKRIVGFNIVKPFNIIEPEDEPKPA